MAHQPEAGLATVGVRPTSQRRAILESLVRMRSHPTAEELFAVVRRDRPNISLATVYKSLESLVAAGLVIKLGGGKGAVRYDGRTDSHYHARCSACGVVLDVEADSGFLAALQGLSLPLARLDRIRLEFHGVCRRCHAFEALASAPHPVTPGATV